MGAVKYCPFNELIKNSTDDSNGVQDSWAASYQEANPGQDTTLSTDHSPLNGKCLKVICTKGQEYNGTHRSELRSHYDKTNEGARGYRVFFPLDYADDPEPEILNQLHESGGSPVISFQSRNGELFFNTNRGTFTNATNIEHTLGSIVKGQWIDIKYKFKVAQNGQGYLKVWRNNVLTIDYTGTLGYSNSNEPPYFKIGIYKWRWSSPANVSNTTQRIVYFDEVRSASGNVDVSVVDPNPTVAPTTFTLTLNEVGTGTTTDETGGGPYESGTVVKAKANPTAGNIFLRWEDSNGEIWDQETVNYTITTNTVLTAYFEDKVAAPAETDKVILHPISHATQKYIVPSNAVNGDNVGKVEHLRSHKEFHNRRFGTNVIDSDYTFSIVGGNTDNAFSIDPATGELTVANITNFTATRTLTVRVSLYAWYYQDTDCVINRIPAVDCIYFDPDSEAEIRDGSRSAPWRKIRTSATESQAGKTYLFRRGALISNDWMVLINSLASSYIQIGAWGQGPRPVINGTNNLSGGKNNRFIQIGGDGFSSSGATPELHGNNISIFDLETTLDDPATNAWYPFEVKPFGKNIEFHRIKCSNIEAFQDGFIWLTGPYESGADPNRNILLRDIECRQFKYRAIKPESGGVTLENTWFYTSLPQTETPLGFATHPYCEAKYIRSKVVDANTSKFGLQVRTHNHNYHWASLDGYPNTLTVYFLSNTYDINSNVGFHDILIKNAIGKTGYFGRANGTTKTANGVVFERVDVVASIQGIEISENAQNTLVKYCDLTGCAGHSVKDYNGTLTKIHNISAGTIDLVPTDAEVINTQYSTILGSPATSTANSTSTLEEDLIYSGVDLGYTKDLRGFDLPSSPSIGAYELSDTSNLAPTVSISGPSNNASFYDNETIAVTVNASDSDGVITKVDLYVNDVLEATDSGAPFSFNINKPVGSYTLKARAFDNDGSYTDSSVINITVSQQPNTLPLVYMSSPANLSANFEEPATIPLRVVTGDQDGSVVKVEYWVDGVLLTTVTQSPFDYDWTNVSAGTYTIFARAFDSEGYTQSENTQVTVQEPTQDYKLNGMPLSTYGIIPARANNSNISIEGHLDFPRRFGKSFQVWDDEEGIEPFVAASEIRFEGRDIIFHALLQGTSKLDAMQKLYSFYELLATFKDKVLFTSKWGSWEVIVRDEVQAVYIKQGLLKLTIRFRQPDTGITAVLSGGIAEPGIDGISFNDLGFTYMNLKDQLGRPVTKSHNAIGYYTEPFQVTKPMAREMVLSGVFISDSYSEMKTKIESLYQLLAKEGVRTLQINNEPYREFFVKDGFEITNIYVGQQTKAFIKINCTEVGEPLFNPEFWTDDQGNLILTNNQKIVIRI